MAPTLWLLLATATLLTAAPPSCGAGAGQCPSDTPCCSQYGQCGVGAFCLQGCDPLASFSLQSCVPMPVCKSGSFALASLDRVASISDFLGDPTKADFVAQGTPLSYQNGTLLTMPKNSVGTVLSWTRYMWYGKVSAAMRSSRGQGVVTSFMYRLSLSLLTSSTMSDVHDEVDWEFVGNDLQQAQSNFYWQAVLNCTSLSVSHLTPDTNSGNHSISDSFATTHTYTIDWSPEVLKWDIDGQTVRTLNKVDTYNATTGNFQYPQTPSRIQFSLWPGGLASNAPGTIKWAGGEIDWNSQDIQKYSYDFAFLESVNIECYGPPPGATVQGQTSYVWLDNKGLNTSIAIKDDKTIISSLAATGTNLTAGGTAANSNIQTQTVQNVPGQGSVAGSSAQGSQGGTSSFSGSSSGSGSASGSSSASGSTEAQNGFNQGKSLATRTVLHPGVLFFIASITFILN
ncbi:putative glycosidase [Neolecta irregularis DAH-3]|uniref:Putative glycosidase n=1 Tax=Neolecta irregularis (strain DAH-3) TaxID=1198029 RepID=A0A1U7LSN0_NEOID|nr:putative glycosidase [Neolecta irregularis DAH-3]|eukprot:OLL25654.1 putative glycosidase [Neolecta irregularis DAH-3]